MLTVTDLFAGAGGSSTGMVDAGFDVRIAANHWPVAVATHQANHPNTDHDCADISQVDPARYPRTDILWASPSCTHHSRAQGKARDAALGPGDPKPATVAQLIDMEPDRSRATMHDVVRFAEHHQYDAVIVENVPEVMKWRLFPYWLEMLTAGLGYQYAPVLLNAADASLRGPAVAQSRLRAYLLFTRGRLDLPTWPAGEHLGADQFLDAELGPRLDSKPRAQRTLDRIAATMERYPDAGRWVVSYYGASRVGKPATAPVGTLTTRDRHALVTEHDGALHYRMLTLPEQARLMGFPSTYAWTGTRQDVIKQIGNAVCPPAARDVSGVIADSLDLAA